MTPFVWLIILIICLVIEFIKIELIGACGAAGSVVGLVTCIFDLNPFIQIAAAVII